MLPRDEDSGLSPGLLPAVRAELDRHEAEADAEVRRHHKARGRHARLVYALGIPAGTLAVIAGSTALADSPGWVTAIIAFASAVTTTAMAIVDPLAGRADHGEKEAQFADLARKVRLARMRSDGVDADEQLAAIESLNALRLELDRKNPVRQMHTGARSKS